MADEKRSDASSDEQVPWPKGGPTQPLTEGLKKLLTAGVSAAFMTEDTIRTFVADLKLPKETLNLLLSGAAKSKEELVQRVGNELAKMVSKIDLVREVSRFAEEHKFKVTMEIEVARKTPSGQPAEPDSKGRAT